MSDQSLRQKGIKTSGRVVEVREDRTRERYKTAYAPVIVYQAGGIEQRYVSNIYSSDRTFRVGETIEVWYDPQHPAELVFGEAPRGNWILLVFALFFGGLGGWLLYSARQP